MKCWFVACFKCFGQRLGSYVWDKNPTYMFSFNVLDETWVKQWFSRKYSDRNVLRLDDFDKNDDVYYIENTRVRVFQCTYCNNVTFFN